MHNSRDFKNKISADANAAKTALRFVAMLICAFALCMAFSISTFAQQTNAQKRVLYISSYSFSWGSVPYQMAGLSEGLGDDYVINYEFMDTKNTVYSDGYREFYDLIKYKLSTRHPYDAVVVCDDAALNFAELYKNDLFKGLPIVFSGIDNVQNAIKAADEKNVTGIAEIVDYAVNMQLAHKLMPKAHRLVLILDNMENGVGIADQLKYSSDVFANYEVEYLNSSEYSVDEFKQKLRELDDSSIVFCISMGQSKDGTVYSEEERYALIRDNVNVPMFRFTQSGIGNGLLGGYIVDHKASCVIAGQMLREMLEMGNEPEIDLDTPHEYYFDYNVMKRYGIKMSDMPEYVANNCEILNEPESFLKAHAFLIVSLLCILLAVTLMIALINRHRHIEKIGKALEDAEQANQAKSEFLARMSHNMRTPMNTIMNLTMMVEHEIDKPESAAADLRNIQNENQFLLTLINDVLDASRIEAGKIELKPDIYGWRELLNYLHCTFDDEAKQKNVELNIVLDSAYDNILIDKERFNQICFNLVSNALRFNHSGGSALFEIKFGDAHDGVLPCNIIVSDNGIGISDSFKNELFTAFKQEGRNYESLQGAGLGLTIVKNIVDAMGGTIDVNSEVNVGTTFTVHLEPQIAPKIQEAKQIAEDDMASLDGKRFLVVEDHPMNQKIAERLLTSAGATAVIADNGKTALDVLNNELDKFDAILMDLRMPVMDGYTATQEIRKLPSSRAKTIPIIAVTANTYSEDIARCMQSGMNAYVAKPIEPNVLFSTIHAQLT